MKNKMVECLDFGSPMKSCQDVKCATYVADKLMIKT